MEVTLTYGGEQYTVPRDELAKYDSGGYFKRMDDGTVIPGSMEATPKERDIFHYILSWAAGIRGPLPDDIEMLKGMANRFRLYDLLAILNEGAIPTFAGRSEVTFESKSAAIWISDRSLICPQTVTFTGDMRGISLYTGYRTGISMPLRRVIRLDMDSGTLTTDGTLIKRFDQWPERKWRVTVVCKLIDNTAPVVEIRVDGGDSYVYAIDPFYIPYLMISRYRAGATDERGEAKCTISN